METVHGETSVESYLVARPPAGILTHQWHVWTTDSWRLRRPLFECVASPEVLRESSRGRPGNDPLAAGGVGQVCLEKM